MYYFELKETHETFADHSIKRLYKIALQVGIDCIREYGHIGNYDIIRIYDANDNQVVSLHFGQSFSDRGRDFSTVRVRTKNHHNNVRSGHFYTVRKYNLAREV